MKGYTIEPYDHPARWLVDNRESGDAYLVELDTKKGHQCTCKWFECHKENTPGLTCKHIKMVVKYVLELVEICKKIPSGCQTISWPIKGKT